TGSTVGTAATTNFFATTGNVYITGVVVLPGIEAPSAARSSLIMRPYDQELATCQRYYWKNTISVGGFSAVATPSFGGLIKHPVTMRVAPNPVSVTGSLTNASALTVDQITTYGFRVFATPTANQNWFGDNLSTTADARL